MAYDGAYSNMEWNSGNFCYVSKLLLFPSSVVWCKYTLRFTKRSSLYSIQNRTCGLCICVCLSHLCFLNYLLLNEFLRSLTTQKWGKKWEKNKTTKSMHQLIWHSPVPLLLQHDGLTTITCRNLDNIKCLYCRHSGAMYWLHLVHTPPNTECNLCAPLNGSLCRWETKHWRLMMMTMLLRFWLNAQR